MRRKTRIVLIILIILIGLLTIMSGLLSSAVELPLEVKRQAGPLLLLVVGVVISLTVVQFLLQAGTEPSAVDTPENRRIMLNRVRAKWITGILENPLYYNEQLLSLPLRERVGSRYDLALYDPLEPAHSLPPDTKILDVFDQARGQLLILGEPGVGKTTLLLELARDLLQRTRTNEEMLIPVVLKLSSWATKKLPLEQWIIKELQLKYDISSQIGEAWVNANQLLLLLDGLDEVALSALPACIEAINAYFHQAHRSLVVCSRTQEFLGQPGRLALHTAVIVQPLSFEQVDTYLDGLAAKGEDIEGLKHVLHQNEALRALAATPLFLTVLILAYHGKSVEELLALVKATSTDQQHLLLRNYIEQRLQRKGTRIHAPAQQTKHWLAWLADQLIEHHQSELYLEQFQPVWLPTRQRAFYRLTVGLFICLSIFLSFVLLFELVGWLFFSLVFGSSFSLAFQPPSGLLFGLLFGLIYGLSQIRPREILTRSWRWRRRSIISGLIGWLVGGLLFGLLFGLILVLRGGQLGGLVPVLLGGLLFGLPFALLGGLLGGFSTSQLDDRQRLTPNQGIWRSALNGLLGGLLGGLLFGLSFVLLLELTTAALFDDRVETGEKNALLYLAQRQVRLELCSNLL